MARMLVIFGVALVLTGLFWPWLSRVGLGRLPGDLVIQRESFTLYLPIATSLIISLLLSAVVWLSNR